MNYNSNIPYNFDIPYNQEGLKSGYYRLFYTQLQEQSLEEDRVKREKRMSPDTAPATDPPGVELVKPKRKAKPKTKQKYSEMSEPDYTVSVMLMPMPKYHSVTLVNKVFIQPIIHAISTESAAWIPVSNYLIESSAANDDEHDIELLLLTA